MSTPNESVNNCWIKHFLLEQICEIQKQKNPFPSETIGWPFLCFFVCPKISRCSPFTMEFKNQEKNHRILFIVCTWHNKSVVFYVWSFDVKCVLMNWCPCPLAWHSHFSLRLMERIRWINVMFLFTLHIKFTALLCVLVFFLFSLFESI